jgi:hypothetical protein
MKYVEASTFGGPEVLEVLEKETPSPWVVYGVRGGKQNSLPAAALFPMIQKNISLLGFSLGGNLQHISRVVPGLFKYAVDVHLRDYEVPFGRSKRRPYAV